MDNQHRHIDGYRELSESEIELVNMIKEAGRKVADLIEFIDGDKEPEAEGAEGDDYEPHMHTNQARFPGIDRRWVAIATTDLQKGFMALTRAVTRPGGF